MNQISRMLPEPALRQSSVLLAQFAVRATGAQSYSFAKVTRSTASRKRPRFPIHVDGVCIATLEFEFDEDPISEAKLILLRETAAAITAVQALPHFTATMIAHTANLDAELAEIKIVDRARGLLAGDVNAEEAFHAIVRHVEQVLSHRQLGSALDRLLPELEERLAERKLLVQAKSLLQERRGMSEEEAYIHLRNRSRTNRKRLREVAEETISQSIRWFTEQREGAGI